MISSEIAMGQPGPVGRFLGCNHVPAESHVISDSFNPREAWSRDDPAKKDPPKLEFGKEIVIPALTASSPGIAGSPAPKTAVPHVSGRKR